MEKYMNLLSNKQYFKDYPNCPTQVPMSLLNEEQAQINHSQSLHTLNDRGGMDTLEIICNIEKRKCIPYRENTSEEENLQKLIEYINKSKLVYDEKWALEEAVKASLNSNCKSKRGVIIWHREHGLISIGWNAPPKPLICDSSEQCRANCAKTAVHAEQAALLKFSSIMINLSECEMLHVKSVDGKAVFSEKPSCWQCSKLILASGLPTMWLYQKEGFVRYSAEEFHEQTLINCDLK